MSGQIGGDEPDAPSSWVFSIEVARAWERAFTEAAAPQTRKVALRSAMTMGPDAGGIFDTLLGLVRRGLGGTAGDGRQFISWIHYEDFVRSIRWLIDHDVLDGAVNISSPNPLPNAAFMRVLRELWGTPVGLPATKWMLEMGAVFMRTETELILKSRRVVPRRLLEHGFVFKYPLWPDAARDLCCQWKRGSTDQRPRDPGARCFVLCDLGVADNSRSQETCSHGATKTRRCHTGDRASRGMDRGTPDHKPFRDRAACDRASLDP